MARKSRKHPLAVMAMPNGSPVRAALYIRLSVEDNQQRGNSIENQQLLLQEYIAGHPEFQAVDVYVDNGLSGTHFNRPGFQRMLADIDAGRIDCVMVKDLSRLGRNLIDTGYYIEQYFFSRHIRFIAVTDGFDTQTADPRSSMLLPIRNMVNEAYALDTGRKVRAQHQQAMRAGLFASGSAPYGYRKAPDNHHVLVTDPQTAPIVRQIFEWVLERIPVSEIAKRLNTAGHLPPAAYKRQNGEIKSDVIVGHGQWTRSGVLSVLHNPVYTGDMAQGKTRKIAHVKRPTPREEWIVVQGTHEPVISHETFDQAQRILADDAEKRMQAKRPFTPNLFQGKVFCMECGKALSRNRISMKRDEYQFYCWNHNCPRKYTHPGALIGEKMLMDVILELLSRELDVKHGKSMTAGRFDAEQAMQKQEISRRIAERSASLTYDRSMLRGLYEDFIQGHLEQKAYIAAKTQVDQRITAGEEEMNRLHGQLEAFSKQTARFQAIKGEAQTLAKTQTLTAEIIGKLIERIEISRNHEIRVLFAFRDAFVERRAKADGNV